MMWEINNFCDYSRQQPLSYERIASELHRNPRTIRCILYLQVKAGGVEIVKEPRPFDVSGDFLSGLGRSVVRRDGTVARKRGRKKSLFILTRKSIDTLTKNMRVDGSGRIHVDIPVTSLSQSEVLTVIEKMRKRKDRL